MRYLGPGSRGLRNAGRRRRCRAPAGAGAGAWRGHEVGVMRERRGGGAASWGSSRTGGTGRRECVREGGDEGRREERRRCWARKAGGFSRLPLGVVGSRLRFAFVFFVLIASLFGKNAAGAGRRAVASVFSCWWSSVPTIR